MITRRAMVVGMAGVAASACGERASPEAVTSAEPAGTTTAPAVASSVAARVLAPGDPIDEGFRGCQSGG